MTADIISQIKTTVLEHIAYGIKGNELAVQITYELHNKKIAVNPEIILETINQMVEDGEILEIEYVLPHIDYRIKSFYLPKGARVIKNAKI